MLNRPTSTPIWSPLRRLAVRLGTLTGASSGLLRYVLIAAILSAICCVYLWQVNNLSALHDRIVELQVQARTLEVTNVALAEQLAQWNSPAYVDKRSAEEGYATAPDRKIQAPAVSSAPVQSSSAP